jgi:hypothetical protein
MGQRTSKPLVGATSVGLRVRFLAGLLAAIVVALPNYGKSNERVKTPKPPYRPVRLDFWQSVDSFIKINKQLEVLKYRSPDTSEAGAVEEWKLGLARALAANGQPIHAQYLMNSVATKSVGTRQGFEALRLIHLMAKDGLVDEFQLEDLAFDLDTKIEEVESRSMIGYFRGRALLRKGYTDWANIAISDVAQASTWGQELRYDRALQRLNAGDSAAAYTEFEALVKNDKTRALTAKQSQLALARLIFERKDYVGAIKIYRGLDIPVRERARSLSEIAWSYYYDREYGKALGAIKALRSRYFTVLFSPETSILEMLIYRELCQYRRVQTLTKAFQKEFGDVYGAIEDRKIIEDVPRFMQMVLQEGMMQKRASIIQSLRAERKAIKSQGWQDDEMKTWLLDVGLRRERTLEAEIQRLVHARIDRVANWFLDLREQVWFLDYESSLKLIQMPDDDASDYEPPQKSKLRTETMFWPVSDESWMDELPDYETLVHSMCRNAPSLMTPAGGGNGP